MLKTPTEGALGEREKERTPRAVGSERAKMGTLLRRAAERVIRMRLESILIGSCSYAAREKRRRASEGTGEGRESELNLARVSPRSRASMELERPVCGAASLTLPILGQI
jgi:hypothetical protein